MDCSTCPKSDNCIVPLAQDWLAKDEHIEEVLALDDIAVELSRDAAGELIVEIIACNPADILSIYTRYHKAAFNAGYAVGRARTSLPEYIKEIKK